MTGNETGCGVFFCFFYLREGGPGVSSRTCFFFFSFLDPGSQTPPQKKLKKTVNVTGAANPWILLLKSPRTIVSPFKFPGFIHLVLYSMCNIIFGAPVGGGMAYFLRSCSALADR